ncbi:MAG: YtxH domain-containing protein [Mycoplasmatales bacterium]
MKAKSFFVGAVFGAVVSGIAVALTTPKKGSELRSDIKKEAETLYKEGMSKVEDSYEVSKEAIGNTKEMIVDKYEVTKNKVAETVDNTKNVVSQKIDEVRASRTGANESTVQETTEHNQNN